MKIFSKILFVLLALILVNPVWAQDEEATDEPAGPWKIDLNTGLYFNQASFSENWTGGGINSVGLTSYFLFSGNYKNGKHNWDNTVDLAYGFNNNQGLGFRKTTDLLLIDTKYGYEFKNSWQLFASLTFQSQFVEGFRYEDDANGVEQELLISDWLAPAFITTAIGVEYKPNDNFYVRVSPITPRITIVRRDDIIFNVPNNYGVEAGETSRIEGYAGQILSEYKKDINDNLSIQARYRLFANYETFRWKEIDHRLGVILTSKVAKLIEVSLNGVLVYDFDQDIGVQWQQGLGVGIAYKFKNFKEEE